MAYFEQLKSSNEGLEYCAATIANGIYAEDHVNFFLWQVSSGKFCYLLLSKDTSFFALKLIVMFKLLTVLELLIKPMFLLLCIEYAVF